jgi:hypothetical protein
MRGRTRSISKISPLLSGDARAAANAPKHERAAVAMPASEQATEDDDDVAIEAPLEGHVADRGSICRARITIEEPVCLIRLSVMRVVPCGTPQLADCR